MYSEEHEQLCVCVWLVFEHEYRNQWLCVWEMWRMTKEWDSQMIVIVSQNKHTEQTTKTNGTQVNRTWYTQSTHDMTQYFLYTNNGRKIERVLVCSTMCIQTVDQYDNDTFERL